jgi:hypothetical protein
VAVEVGGEARVEAAGARAVNEVEKCGRVGRGGPTRGHRVCLTYNSPNPAVVV